MGYISEASEITKVNNDLQMEISINDHHLNNDVKYLKHLWLIVASDFEHIVCLTGLNMYLHTRQYIEIMHAFLIGV